MATDYPPAYDHVVQSMQREHFATVLFQTLAYGALLLSSRLPIIMYIIDTSRRRISCYLVIGDLPPLGASHWSALSTGLHLLQFRGGVRVVRHINARGRVRLCRRPVCATIRGQLPVHAGKYRCAVVRVHHDFEPEYPHGKWPRYTKPSWSVIFIDNRQIYRTYVVWNRSWQVIALPIIVLAAQIGLCLHRSPGPTGTSQLCRCCHCPFPQLLEQHIPWRGPVPRSAHRRPWRVGVSSLAQRSQQPLLHLSHFVDWCVG
jgi:hypothetical protein